MPVRPLRFVLAAAGAAALAAWLAPGAAVAAEPVAATFAPPPDFYPESMAVGPDGTVYVGSWHQGAVARLKPGQRTARIFVPPGSNGLTNAQGLLVDTARRLLWVCSGDLGYVTVPRHPSALKAYDLATGAPRGSYDLPGGGYCNDLALAGDGRIYVTDSLHPRILELDGPGAALRDWVEDKRFCKGADGFCLNGIAIDPGRAIYVSTVAASTTLLKVGLQAAGKPGPVSEVRFPRVLKNADGVRWLGGGRLLIFESNAFAKNDPLDGSVSIATLRGDGSAGLETIVNGLADPSSGLAYRGRIYVLQSKYEILLRHKPDEMATVPRGVPFTIQSVPLPPAH